MKRLCLFLFFIWFFTAPYSVHAQSNQTSMSIASLVVNPNTGQDLHDLQTTDPNFSENQPITFHIIIQNNGTVFVNNATVTDNLPEYVTFMNGPGRFDSTNQTLTFQITNLAPGQTQTITIQGKLFSLADLPPLPHNCAVNEAIVTTPDDEMLSDSSQFCITPTTDVTPIPSSEATPTPKIQSSSESSSPTNSATSLSQPLTTSPITGASPFIFAGLIISGIGGFSLIRFAQRKTDTS